MALIDVDYRDVINKAERLDDAARELRCVAENEMRCVQSDARRNWSGSASELYQKRMGTYISRLAAQADDLQKLAKSLRKTAEKYEKIEKLAQTLFKG